VFLPFFDKSNDLTIDYVRRVSASSLCGEHVEPFGHYLFTPLAIYDIRKLALSVVEGTQYETGVAFTPGPPCCFSQ
jgi:hypothetical protein